MLLKILGWVWLIAGIFFLIKPGWFRNHLQKKGVKKMKKWLFGIALLLGIMLIKASMALEGILGTILLVVGIIGVVKAFFFLQVKAAEHILEWCTKQSLGFYRISACMQIAFGAFLIWIK